MTAGTVKSRAARLTRPGPVVLLTVLAAGLVVVSASRAWAHGTTLDGGLGTRSVSVTGTQSVPGLVALALAAAAAAIAAATAGRIGRLVALVALALVTAGLGYGVLHFVTDAAAVVGSVAATRTGRTGRLDVTTSLTPWPWLAGIGVLVLVLATVLTALGRRRWRGLSARYQVEPGDDVSGRRGERVGSDWDRLSQGIDPTDDTDGPN